MDAVVELPFELRPPIVVERPKGSGAFVRLSDDYRRTVVYLGHPKPGADREISPVGTGFLLHMGGPMGGYLVTAGHVARELEGIPFAVRININSPDDGGGGYLQHFDEVKWYYHPTDETVDIAVMPYEPPKWADFGWFPYKALASSFKLHTKDIGPGDMAYVVGLLHFMHGKTRNMPTVYTGHIALMPDGERIPITDWRNPSATEPMYADAYLVEANALPGSSGSPVFVRRTLKAKQTIPDIQDAPINTWMHGSVWLLGIWRGAWFGKASDGLNLPSTSAKVPVGMGTVVPAYNLIQVLDHPELQKMRKDAVAAEDLARAPEPLSLAKGAHAGDEILKTMLNTPPEPRATKAKGKKKPA